MISSRILLLLFTIIFIASYSSAAQCDERGRCKYGGRCGPGNECICPMKCSTKSWKVDINSLYCAPNKGGRPDIFWNICFVLAEACERQEDVPLIAFDFNKPTQCEAAVDSRWRLCSKPEDFTGPCGGTLEFSQQSGDLGGVCLMDINTHFKRCECPSRKSGSQCQQKEIIIKAVTKEENPKETSTACDFIGVSIGASVGAGVLLGMLMFALIRKCLTFTKHNDATEHKKFSYGSPDRTETSRTDNKLYCETSDESSLANNHCVISIGTHNKQLSPVAAEDFTASKRSEKRQRLNGSSRVKPEDTNNNFGSNKSRTTTREPINCSKSAPEMGLNFSEDSGFTQGLTENSCSQNDAYTI